MTDPNQAPARPSEPLLPCPFCGGTMYHRGKLGTGHTKDCYFLVPDRSLIETESEIAKHRARSDDAWNRRAADPRAAAGGSSLWDKLIEARDEYKARAERAEAEAAGRLAVLNEKAEEARREWIRAEQAEARVVSLEARDKSGEIAKQIATARYERLRMIYGFARQLSHNHSGDEETGEHDPDCEACLVEAIIAATDETAEQPAPRPEGDVVLSMILPCPRCGELHVDAPEPEKGWTNPPHKSHLCHYCGLVWRPADVPTNGVASIATIGKDDNWKPSDAGRDGRGEVQSAADDLARLHADGDRLWAAHGHKAVGRLLAAIAALRGTTSKNEEHG